MHHRTLVIVELVTTQKPRHDDQISGVVRQAMLKHMANIDKGKLASGNRIHLVNVLEANHSANSIVSPPD